jgi:NAD(P)-dependent dehydrogenase (short-subunit alcohol dehydrogenase family)
MFLLASRQGLVAATPLMAPPRRLWRLWAKDLQDTGVTVNILLPGGASDTKLLPDGSNRWGADGALLFPRLMRAPTLGLCSDDSQNSTALRCIARLWDNSLPRADAAKSALDKSTFFS